MENVFVWLNGQILPSAEALVPVHAPALTLGEGVFETLVWMHDRVLAARRHWQRLRAGCDLLGLDAPDFEVFAQALTDVVRANGSANHRLRFTAGRSATGGADWSAVATPLKPWPAEEAVVIAPWCKNERSPLIGVKTTSYAESLTAKRYADQHQFGEALLANTRGELCEGSGSNVFLVIDDVLITPPLSSGCLPGVTREILLEQALQIAERPIEMAELSRATEMFLTSSTRHVQPVGRVGDRPLTGSEGKWTRQAAAALEMAYRSE